VIAHGWNSDRALQFCGQQGVKTMTNVDETRRALRTNGVVLAAAIAGLAWLGLVAYGVYEVGAMLVLGQ